MTVRQETITSPNLAAKTFSGTRHHSIKSETFEEMQRRIELDWIVCNACQNKINLNWQKLSDCEALWLYTRLSDIFLTNFKNNSSENIPATKMNWEMTHYRYYDFLKNVIQNKFRKVWITFYTLRCKTRWVMKISTKSN